MLLSAQERHDPFEEAEMEEVGLCCCICLSNQDLAQVVFSVAEASGSGYDQTDRPV